MRINQVTPLCLTLFHLPCPVNRFDPLKPLHAQPHRQPQRRPEMLAHYPDGYQPSCGMGDTSVSKRIGEGSMYKEGRATEASTPPWVFHGLGYLLSEGDRGEIEEMYPRAMRGYEKAWGLEHISTLDTVNNLGNLGRMDEAEKMLLRGAARIQEGRPRAHLHVYRLFISGRARPPRCIQLLVTL
ncbi:hypothetical protein B0J11DRAFT_194482 [Dendryphion nanum]|uniref:Uncharacterized protein n=1 Tax=Dendryphion nanum TaxID=256645 RepID=A0A9P9D226_9PLEO|nr:hypothetical protein B0J11DRAFT_194482 [Dendryphion nanum]